MQRSGVPVHGTPSQQSPDTVQLWPYCAHVVPPVGGGGGGGGGGAVPTGGGGGGGGGGVYFAPQVPFVEPGSMTHGEPAQQSAVVVHDPAAGMQATPEQTRTPAAFGVQGWLQQSALVAQAVPAGGGPFAAQS
jgi:hypothetical protein